MLMALKPGDNVVARSSSRKMTAASRCFLFGKYFEKRWTTLADAAKSGEPVEVIIKID